MMRTMVCSLNFTEVFSAQVKSGCQLTVFRPSKELIVGDVGPTKFVQMMIECILS